MDIENDHAYELLCDWLSDEQRACYDMHGHFYVTARTPSHRPVYYLLHDGWEAFRVDSRGPVFVHNFGTGYYAPLPKEDSLLTQMLLLQTDLPRFHEIACSLRLWADHYSSVRKPSWKHGYPGRITGDRFPID